MGCELIADEEEGRHRPAVLQEAARLRSRPAVTLSDQSLIDEMSRTEQERGARVERRSDIVGATVPVDPRERFQGAE